jgi:chromosome segregation ATPase
MTTPEKEACLQSDLTAARAEIERLEASIQFDHLKRLKAEAEAAQSEVSALKEEVGRLKGEVASADEATDSAEKNQAIWCEIAEERQTKITSLQSMITEKDVALRFYANSKTYEGNGVSRWTPASEDCGKCARTALNSTEAKTGGGA